MAESDWDFQGTTWAITTAQYVSAPSSLTATGGLSILSRRADCQVLPQGQIVTQFRGHSTDYLHLFCRNQAALGLANYENCYQLMRISTGASASCVVRRRESGSVVWEVSLGTLDALSIDTWYKFRFTWWNDWGKVRFRLERWVTDAWVQEGVDVEDPTNKWATSSINRVGLYPTSSQIWYDDTEIRGPI